jgi:MFS transporter, SP family, sugar:H+ symporter
MNAGGVTSMPSFLQKFFPDVYKRTQEHTVLESNYCKYDNQKLQLFTSSLYLAALVASMIASPVTRKLGRKQTMLLAGILFIVGTVLSASAGKLILLIFGRILLGCGVGFANQVLIYTKIYIPYFHQKIRHALSH